LQVFLELHMNAEPQERLSDMTLSRREFTSVLGLSLANAASRFPSIMATSSSRQDSDTDWSTVRGQFDLSPGWLHFAQFYLVSHPRPVREAIERYRRLLDLDPYLTVEQGMGFAQEGQTQTFPRLIEQEAAAYLGGKPEELALTDSTTQGLALIYMGLRLKNGDEILTTTHDHYVHHEAIRLAVERNAATTRRIALYDNPAEASAEQMIERLRRALTPRTRVVGLTWVHSSTGVKLPLRALAQVVADANRERNERSRTLLVVDGVHGLGNQNETVAELGCDFFAAGTHKWILAPRGTGIIWAAEENWKLLRPTIPTFYSLDPFRAWANEQPLQSPTRASWISPGGSKAYEHQWAMADAFRFHRRIGPQRVSQRITALNTLCKDGLRSIPHVKVLTPGDPSLSGGIICFQIEGQTPEETVRRLFERRIIASASPYKVSYARLAPSLVNDEQEVETVLRTVRDIA
jgi:isopenicillin-N epimerase